MASLQTVVLTAILSCFIFEITHVLSAKKEDCEVCVAVVEKFSNTLADDVKSNPKKIEKEFKKFCKTTKSKENRFCYYLGGLEESATGILGELSKPLSWSMPANKVCEKLKKRILKSVTYDMVFINIKFLVSTKLPQNVRCDSTLVEHFLVGWPCPTMGDKTIDLKTVDLKKLKVRDLRKILSDWDETCEGCIEKSDFIKRIEELKPQYMHSEL